jgi:hypothetical protein
VSVVLTGHHLADRAGLIGCELGRHCPRTTAPVPESAHLIQPTPSVIARGREAKDSQGDSQRDGPLGPSDYRQDGSLGLAGWYAQGVQPVTRETNQNEQQSHDGKQDLHATFEPQDLGSKLLLVPSEQVRCDDRSSPTPQPTHSRRAWDTELHRHVWILLVADEVSNPVVVGAASGAVRHPMRMTRTNSRHNSTTVCRTKQKSPRISAALQLHTPESRMLWHIALLRATTFHDGLKFRESATTG